MEIACSLPPSPVMAGNTSSEEYAAVTYSMAISNDGMNFSAEVDMTVYDSLCMECNGTDNCQEKVYHQNFHAFNNRRLVCFLLVAVLGCRFLITWNTLQMTACHIDGRCARPNDINNRDVCVLCDLSKSRTSWTPRSGNRLWYTLFGLDKEPGVAIRFRCDFAVFLVLLLHRLIYLDMNMETTSKLMFPSIQI